MVDLWSKGHGFKSWQEWQENFLLQGQLSVLTFIWYPFHSCVNCYHIKNPGHFAKSASGCLQKLQLYTLCMRLYMKWCDMVYGCVVYTEHTKMAAVLSGTSHVRTTETVLQVLHHLDGYSKHAVIIIINNSYKFCIRIVYIHCMCLYIFLQLFVRCIVPYILLGTMCYRKVYYYYNYKMLFSNQS